MKTILAPVSAKTPKGLKIKEAKLRGVDSHGMLCSAKDLAISEEDGIVDLPQDTKLGAKLSELPMDILSSTPWYKFKEVESFWQLPGEDRIVIARADNEIPKDSKLLSKTYFSAGKYLYRHFN